LKALNEKLNNPNEKPQLKALLMEWNKLKIVSGIEGKVEKLDQTTTKKKY
jgi:hypothetical protein